MTKTYFRGDESLLKTFVLLGIVIAFVVQFIAFEAAHAVNGLVGIPWGGVLMFAVMPPYLGFSH